MTEKTFEGFDKFDRKPFAERLTKVISTFYPFSDEAYVLSLDAKFGSGKTTFLEMWKSYLEFHNYKVVQLNAWETDFCNDPIIPIMSTLMDNIKTGKGVQKFKNAIQGALGVGALFANGYIEQKTGYNIKEIGESVEKDLSAKSLRAMGKELYKEYTFKEDAYKNLKKALSEYVAQLSKKPLVIFVDELDRVRPDYAVKFLEAIKHIFAVQGVCFVLAVDRAQLEESVKQLYGNIDFDNYYRRFVTREASLPSSNTVELRPFIQQLATKYFDEKEAAGIRYPFANGGDKTSVLSYIETICRTFGMTPRNVELLFHIFSQFLAIESSTHTANILWMRASIFLIAVSIIDNELYNNIGNASATPNELYALVENLDFTWGEVERQKWYLMRDAMSFILNDNVMHHKEIKNIMSKFVKNNNNNESIIDSLCREVSGHFTPERLSVFQKIYARLESWRSFIE